MAHCSKVFSQLKRANIEIDEFKLGQGFQKVSVYAETRTAQQWQPGVQALDTTMVS